MKAIIHLAIPCCCAGFLLLPCDVAGSVKWKPIDASDRALAAGLVERDADAEALFWDVRVSDELAGGDPQTVLDHYIRIKVFTPHGRDTQSKVEIPHGDGIDVKEVLGRTIKPDGTVIDLKKTDVFERATVKGNGFRQRTTSFVLPGVEPGAIVEYQWREYRRDSVAMYIHLECQRDIPVQVVRYHVRPLQMAGLDYRMRIEAYNGRNTDFVEDKEDRGYLTTTMTGIPAFHEEPHMPADHDVKPWLLIYYTRGGRAADPMKFWKEYASDLYDAQKTVMKADNGIREAARAATASAKTLEEKVQRLLEVCRKIRRTDLPDSAPSTNRKRSPAKNAAEVLARGEGDRGDVYMVFGALAVAAGLDARVAALTDRAEMAHVPNVGHAYFMTGRVIAIRDGGSWRFVNPANLYASGTLGASQEACMAVIADPKEAVLATTPVSEPNVSVRRRAAELSLAEDGTLDGDVTFTYTGHLAADLREADRSRNVEEREKSIRDFVIARLPGADVTSVRIEHATDLTLAYQYAFHLRVPGYAQATASRLLLMPALFEQRAPPVFTAAARRHPINFDYAWTERDRVTLALPNGYRPDEVSQPQPIEVDTVAGYRASIEASADGRTLTYTRRLFFGGRGHLEFPVDAYSAVKLFFDTTQEQDRHTISVRKSAGGGQ